MNSSTRHGKGPGKLKALSVAAVAILAFQGIALAANKKPHFTSIDPAVGDVLGGTHVLISGSNFVTGMVVKFGANFATCDPVVNGSPDTITCTTPPGPFGSVTLQLRNPGGKGGSRLTTVPNGFTYICSTCSVSPVSFTIDGAFALTEPNGILEPGESATFAPAWFNNDGAVTLTTPNFIGTLSAFSGPQNGSSEPTYSITDGAGVYPTLAPQTSGTCSNCYTLSVGPITAGRPSVHMDATVTETPSLDAGSTQDTADAHTFTIHIGHSFVDEPDSDVFYVFIENLLHNGLTAGCPDTPGGFCPGQNVIRAQMAIFLARGIAGGDGAVPDSGTVNGTPYDCVNGPSLFGDVPVGSVFCKHIHYIANLNVTQGCGGGNFCPGQQASRQEMAAFVARALLQPGGEDLVPVSYGPDPVTGFSYDCTAVTGTPPGPNGGFPDVALGSQFCSDIGYIWAVGVVSGFPDGTYGGSLNVTRAQMAKFLVNGFAEKLDTP